MIAPSRWCVVFPGVLSSLSAGHALGDHAPSWQGQSLSAGRVPDAFCRSLEFALPLAELEKRHPPPKP
jgi:hypothetical protein